jgi:UDP-N-acetylglucosamine 2-epimerase (non-hydrolysing)
VKLGIRLVHVEAGLRSRDRTMPEEINRILTDAISDLLFCTEQSGVDNLIAEGVPRDRIHLVGNVMIDTLLKNKQLADRSTVLDELGLERRRYAVLTLHRPSNVDDPATFDGILDALEVVQSELPIVFPVHPRTRRILADSPLGRRAEAMSGLRLLDPIGFLDFLKLMSDARIVLTDSGGIQEETTILKVPCLTLRENTERPITTEIGSNRIVGTDTTRILDAFRAVMDGKGPPCDIPPLWDGSAAKRITKILLQE